MKLIWLLEGLFLHNNVSSLSQDLNPDSGETAAGAQSNWVFLTSQTTPEELCLLIAISFKLQIPWLFLTLFLGHSPANLHKFSNCPIFPKFCYILHSVFTWLMSHCRFYKDFVSQVSWLFMRSLWPERQLRSPSGNHLFQSMSVVTLNHVLQTPPDLYDEGPLGQTT